MLSSIGLHLRNIFKEGELEEQSTTEDFSVVQTEGKRQIKRTVKFYNLDAIISVGYRVNSKQGTQFRQWATQRLREYLVQGYVVNEKRLAQKQQEVQTLKDGIRILSRAVEEKMDAVGLEWLGQFARGLELLDDYDHEQLDGKGLSNRPAVYPAESDYQGLIDAMKDDFDSAVFGLEKDGSFRSAIAQISKGFGEEDFMFQLTEGESESLRSHIVTLNKRGTHSKYLPNVFTEQGVAMLSSVLRSPQAIQVNIQIMRIFTRIRQMLMDNAEMARNPDFPVHKLLNCTKDLAFRILFATFVYNSPKDYA